MYVIEIRDTRYEVRDTRYEVRGTIYDIRYTRYEIAAPPRSFSCASSLLMDESLLDDGKALEAFIVRCLGGSMRILPINGFVA
jgi:hypothetical protein